MGRYGIELTADQRRILGISYGRYKDCGSNEGWIFHRKAHEAPCGDCVRARGLHVESLCGSYVGFMLHRNMKTEICGRCADAARDYNAARRAISAPQGDLCGTNDGWLRHRRAHTGVCGPCDAARDAFTAGAQDRRLARRTAWARQQLDAGAVPGAAEYAAHLVRCGWNAGRALAHARTAYDIMAPHIRAAVEQEGEGDGYRLHSA